MDFLNRPPFSDYFIDADPELFQLENFDRLEKDLISIYGTGDDYLTYNLARQHPGEHEQLFLGRLTRLYKRKRNIKTLNEIDLQEITDKFIMSLNDPEIARKLLERRDDVDHASVADRAKQLRMARIQLQHNVFFTQQANHDDDEYQCGEEFNDHAYDDDDYDNYYCDYDDYYCDCDDDACVCADYDDTNVEDQNYAFYTEQGDYNQENCFSDSEYDSENDNCVYYNEHSDEQNENTHLADEDYHGENLSYGGGEEFHEFLRDYYLD